MITRVIDRNFANMRLDRFLRKAFPDAKKVTASRKRGEATFLTDQPIEEEKLKRSIAETGYTFLSVSSEPYRKKGLFG